MPELPDLVHVEELLGPALAGRTITAARVGDPTVLRVMVTGTLPELVLGRRVQGIGRRGHFMRFLLVAGSAGARGNKDDVAAGRAAPPLVLVVNAMLVGRYQLFGPTQKRPAPPRSLGLALTFDGGLELRYVDEKRMGKVYLVPAAREAEIPIYGALGVDVLSPAFTRRAFAGLLAGRRDQVRVFLLDKGALASIGNAYADEILFAARIHPKTFCRALAPSDADRLYRAIGDVLGHAIAEIRRRGEAADLKVRDFLAVRGKNGTPCPNCGTTLRAVRVGAGDACFCPACQPATRRLFVDWSRTG